MKKDANLIPFAGSQLHENRHVCAFFNSMTKSIACCFRLSKTGSTVAIRRFMSLFQINVTIIWAGWRRRTSTRPPPKWAGSSSFANVERDKPNRPHRKFDMEGKLENPGSEIKGLERWHQ
jgi:hypothetical protein